MRVRGLVDSERNNLDIVPGSGKDTAGRTASDLLLQKLAAQQPGIRPPLLQQASVLALLDEVPVAPSRVFLMPKALTVVELEANQSRVAALARDHGFRYSDRLHLRLFGAKRGV